MSKHDIEDWKYEVANDDTVLGYQEWLDRKMEEEEYDAINYAESVDLEATETGS